MRRSYLLPLLLLTVFASPSRAEIVFGFAAGPEATDPFFWTPPSAPSGIGTTNLNITPGETARISVFVVQRGGDTRLSEFGLFQSSFQASFDPTAGQVTSIISDSLPFEGGVNPPTPLNRFTVGPDASFDNDLGLLNLGGSLDVDDSRFQAGDIPGLGTGSAFVGFFDFQVTGDAPISFTFTDPNPSDSFSNNSLYGRLIGDGPMTEGFDDLDPEFFPGGGPSNVFLTINATAIPEPSSVIALTAICGLGLVRRRRRRA